MSTPRLKITYKRSVIGRSWRQKRIITALGLRKLHQSVEHDDSPIIRGMINKVSHLLEVETVEG